MSERKWYFNSNLKPQGPFSEDHIRRLIHHGQIGPYDLLLEESGGQSGGQWRAAQEWGCFEQRLFPAHQSPDFADHPDLERRDWVLIRHDGEKDYQDGPYGVREILRLLKQGQITFKTLAWKSGLSGWVQLQERSEFRTFEGEPRTEV